ncbi:hypothetical protein MGYG_00509 [Nannizzia gypsea CBS 118893]|uniref:Uncharacterized protein n=1 Tax=Arthroderma gypseum (strain ATCC MYA-4604 / CBS 118893) TaxID=535722 RepID=E5R057_ARTGP|nr:hypothetical protein MGYG_00509 [Nannizzia gypsea CBS 118893]EFQ97468.1 hypothetical protein MGYG_00509 [Nannizzia gypsea CBS 118893]
MGQRYELNPMWMVSDIARELMEKARFPERRCLGLDVVSQMAKLAYFNEPQRHW